MQNSILMKDTQLFLTEDCLSWLFLFIPAFKYLPISGTGPVVTENYRRDGPKSTEEEMAGAHIRGPCLPSPTKVRRRQYKKPCTGLVFSVATT